MQIRFEDSIIDPRSPIQLRAEMVGIVGREHLAERGFITQSQLQEGITSGRFERVARGRYALPHAHPHFRVAISKRGRVACLSACFFYGIWVREPSSLHIAISGSAPTPSGTGLTFHRMRILPTEPIVDLGTALVQVCSCADAETALIAVESALNQQFITSDHLPEFIAKVPAKTREVLSRVITTAQSGSETRVRNFFLSRRVRVSFQVAIPGIGYVDLLVGESLIVECDSRAHHTSASDYHKDRVRDAHATVLGYTVIRLSYQQIWDEWEQTQAYLLQVIRTGKHRRPPTPL